MNSRHFPNFNDFTYSLTHMGGGSITDRESTCYPIQYKLLCQICLAELLEEQ